jgi:hypothetical protein
MPLTCTSKGCKEAADTPFKRCVRHRLANQKWAHAHPQVITPELRERARERAAAWYRANKTRALESCKRRYETISVEIRRARKREYYARNKEKVRLINKRSNLKNSEKVKAANREYTKRWRQANPDVVKLQKKAWKAKRRASGPLPMAVIKEIRTLFPECVYCGASGSRDNPLTLEHLVAVASGGTNEKNNLASACNRCNSSRQKKPWREWYCATSFFDPARAMRLSTWETGPCP